MTQTAAAAGATAAAGKGLKGAKAAKKTKPKKKNGLADVGRKENISFYGAYSTKIDSKVTVIEKQELPSWLIDTYKDGQYRTVVTNEEIIVYRSFGYNAEAGGAFALFRKEQL